MRIMRLIIKHKFFVSAILMLLVLSALSVSVLHIYFDKNIHTSATSNEENFYIKWFEFNATNELLTYTLKKDISSRENGSQRSVNWIEIIACLATKKGGNLKSFKNSEIDDICTRLQAGETAEKISGSEKYYNYYYEGYKAALGGLVGYYEIEQDENAGKAMGRKYGLKGFSPIAKGYGFSHYDDFGAGRTYGFKRKHLGNDLMGSIGTPIIAIESGIVEALGWNKYGGWRIGIRSLDGMRYYYYAHLRKDRPYHNSLFVGKTITAGDVIGYLGMSGYSDKENTNNINIPHLHLGLQLIFDESQKDSNNEIWIDMYQLVEFLQKNKSAVQKDDTKEYNRVYNMRDPGVYE